jgi:hypothetical protein
LLSGFLGNSNVFRLTSILLRLFVDQVKEDEMEELHNLRASRNRWVEHVARFGEVRNACKILVGKPEGTRPLGRRRRRWDENIRINLWEMVWHGVDWMHMTQNRDWWRPVVNTVMNLRVT